MGQRKTEVIAISSGKGGVGKTTLAVNLGISLAKQGQRVCLFDADTNLANINIMLGETPQHTLQHVLDGEKSINEILVNTHGLSLIPGASGVTGFSELGYVAQTRLLKALSNLEQNYDVILVDTAAGIHEDVLNFIQSAHQSIVLITPEPTSLTDAFSLLRMLRKQKYRKRINVVVNQSVSELGARQVFKRFSAAVAKYIGYHPAYLGYVSRDENVPAAVVSQLPVRQARPDAIASQCFDRLAHSLWSLLQQQIQDSYLSEMWSKEVVEPEVVEVVEVDVLPSTESNPVPASNRADNDKEWKENNAFYREVHYKQADKTRKKQVLEEHKQAIVDFIDDPDFGKQEIDLTLDRFLSRFFKRFKDFPGDPVEQINILLQTNVLTQAQINQLLSELMLFYKDNRLRVDRDSNAEFLNQQINDYVEEYQSYPFDAVQAVMHSISLGQVSHKALAELTSVLGLAEKAAPLSQVNKPLSQINNSVSQIKPSEPPVKNDSKVYATDIEEDRSELVDSIKQQIHTQIADDMNSYEAQGLIDSISFASKLND